MKTTIHQIAGKPGSCSKAARNTIGGAPILQNGQSVPFCQLCGKEMGLYLQFDIDSEFNLPFIEGSHFLIFSCVHCEEIPAEQYSDQDQTVLESYKQGISGHYCLFLNRPAQDETVFPDNGLVKPKEIKFSKKSEAVERRNYLGKTSDYYGFKLGGTASWINYSVNLKCTCGAPIVFLCQIPEGYSFAEPHLTLFIGNHIYILGCAMQCHPHALIAVCDN